MNFERGKDPKRAIHIGRWANAIEIIDILEYRMTFDPAGEVHCATYEKHQLKETIIVSFLSLLDSLKSFDKKHIVRKFPVLTDKSKKFGSWINLAGKDIIYKDKLYRMPQFYDGEKIVSLEIKQVS